VIGPKKRENNGEEKVEIRRWLVSTVAVFEGKENWSEFKLSSFSILMACQRLK
jgi:hypothetical protein